MLGVDDLFQDMRVPVVLVTLHEEHNVLKSDEAGDLASILLLGFKIACGKHL
jgi:hypothetical protein